MEIVATRNSNDRFTSSVDNFRERIKVEPIPAFKRTQNFVLSPNAKILDFAIIDTEIPSDNPFFPGMVDMNISHTVSSKLKGQGFNVWSNTISGTITTAPGTKRILPWLAFLDIVKTRTDRASFVRSLFKATEKGPIKSLPARWIISAVSITEPIYGRTFSFSFKYLLIVDPGRILAGSGLFQGVPGNWLVHRDSLFKGVSNVRGAAGLLLKRDDRGDSSCLRGNSLVVQTNVVPPVAPIVGRPIFDTPCPPPEDSWLQYHLDHEIDGHASTYIHTSMNVVPQNERDDAAEGHASGLDTEFNVVSLPNVPKNRQVVQLRGGDSTIIVIKGFAIRLGYRIKPPTLLSIDGRKVIKLDDNATSRLLWSGKCPVYVATWRQEYALDTVLPIGGDLMDKMRFLGIPKQYQTK